MAARRVPLFLFVVLALGPLVSQPLPPPGEAQGLKAAAAGSAAAELNFPEAGAMRAVLRPVEYGTQAFAARVAAARREGREPLGLVLAGGSARAYAHIGVLQVLEAKGIYPDFIVANSMGAVVGMLYAAGLPPALIARIVTTVPPDSRLDLVLPTKGGFINAERFVAAVKSLVGDIDLAQAKIPILVTAEDLKTRRQLRLAAGSFSRVMSTSFAIPAVFEPVPFDDYLLVDGGLTNVVPVDIAAEYTGALIVSTALYDRPMDFGNPVSVLNRAVDIAKTRAGIGGVLELGGYVIRNRVEDISYMQFANPEGIIELGRLSAEAVVDDIAAGLGPTYILAGPPSGLAEARASYEASVPPALAALRRGAIPPASPTARYKIRLKLADPFEPSPLDLDAQAYAGVELCNEAGRTRSSLGILFGLEQAAGRQWGLDLNLAANPVDTLLLQAALRLWGDFGSWSSYAVEPDSFEAAVRLAWPGKDETLLVEPRLGGSLLFRQKTKALSWTGSGGLALGAEWRGWLAAKGFPGLEGFGEVWGGCFASSGTSAPSWGPEWNLKLGLAWPEVTGLRARTWGRWDAAGSGLAPSASFAFRGPLPSVSATLPSVLNLDLVWLAKALEFDVGETILVKNIEAGPYFDYLALAGGSPSLGKFATGLSLGLTASFVGLAPLDLSLFAGFDEGGLPVLGLRSGRLFPAFK